MCAPWNWTHNLVRCKRNALPLSHRNMSLLTNLMHLNKQNNTLNSGVCDLRTCKDANYASRNLNRSALWTCSRCDWVSLYFRTESKLSRLRSSHLSSSHPSVKPNGPEKQQVKRRVVPWHQASFLREFRLQRMPAWQERRGGELLWDQSHAFSSSPAQASGEMLGPRRAIEQFEPSPGMIIIIWDNGVV